MDSERLLFTVSSTILEHLEIFSHRSIMKAHLRNALSHTDVSPRKRRTCPLFNFYVFTFYGELSIQSSMNAIIFLVVYSQYWRSECPPCPRNIVFCNTNNRIIIEESYLHSFAQRMGTFGLYIIVLQNSYILFFFSILN